MCVWVRVVVCLCGWVARLLSNLQFIILQFTICALNFNFCLCSLLSTVIIMFHFAIQVFALAQVILCQLSAKEIEIDNDRERER